MNTTKERVYEEFDPIVRWESQPEFDNLVLYLPGFRKEQMKVQVTSARKLRVMGERPAGGATNNSNWIRFHKEFPLPSNLNIDTITAKFEGVNLHVKLPKLASHSTGEPKPPATTDVAKPPQPQAQKTGNGHKPSNEATGPHVRPVTQPKLQPRPQTQPPPQPQPQPQPLKQKQLQPQPQPQKQQPAEENLPSKHASSEAAELEDGRKEGGEKRQMIPAASADLGGVSKRAKRGDQDTLSTTVGDPEERAKSSQNYKKLLTEIRMKFKKKPKLSIGLAVAAALVLAIGMYASRKVRCTIGESDI